MRGHFALAAAALCAASLAGAQETLRRGWPLAPDGSVKVHNLVGRVRIVGWDRDSVAVEGSIGASLRFYGGGNRGGIKVGVEGDPQGETTATLVLHVPATANVAVRGAATDIEIEGLLGTVDAATVGGRLHVTGSPRSLTVETMDGALTILGAPGILRARTASGALVWEGTAREATLTTIDGPVRVLTGPLERARIETISGRVSLGAALSPSADISIESHGGNVELAFDRAVPVRLTVEAARITGDRVSMSERAPARPGDPRVLYLNGASDPGTAARISVRSFKGHVLVRGP
jgi:hypothetical protein